MEKNHPTRKLTVREFFKQFPSEDACLEHVMKVRFGLRHTCGECGVVDATFHRLENRKKYSCAHCGAHVAAATAAGRAARSLRLKIGITNFRQERFLSICEERADSAALLYGNGSWWHEQDAAAGGTGSSPPRAKGWQRISRHAASMAPRIGPWAMMACDAYSEQVGRYLHPPGPIECSAGESQRR